MKPDTDNAAENTWLRSMRRSASQPLPESTGSINAAIRAAAGRAPVNEPEPPDAAA
jgi:hypothetical protein